MSVVTKPLITAKYASNSETTEYTAGAGTRTLIDKFTGYNSSGAGVVLSIKLVPSGGSAGASNLIIHKTITAGETYTFPEVVGHVLAASDFISTLAGTAASITIRASGREVS